MTRDEVMALELPELKHAVILYVMCWHVERHEFDLDWWCDETGVAQYQVGWWDPVDDIAAAWQVVEKMAELDFGIDNLGHPPNEWRVVYDFGGIDEGHKSIAASTAPIAICRAALLDEIEGKG